MKNFSKNSTLLIVFAIVILLLTCRVIYYSKFSKSANSVDSLDSKMKEATAQVMVNVYRRGYGIKGVTAFENNPYYIAVVNKLITNLKEKDGIVATSSIKSASSSFVARLMVSGANEFYCGDTIHQQSGIIVVPLVGDNFTSSTDCSGDELK